MQLHYHFDQLWRTGGIQGMYYEIKSNVFFFSQKLPGKYYFLKGRRIKENAITCSKSSNLCIYVSYILHIHSHTLKQNSIT